MIKNRYCVKEEETCLLKWARNLSTL